MAAMFFGQDTSYSVYADEYRQRKNNQAKLKQANTTERMPNLESYDIQVSITATKYNHYKYINPQLWFNKTWIWANAPMELINMNVLQCSLKIMDSNHKKVKKHMKTFDFTPRVNIIVPIHITNYSFVYKHDSIPEVLHNKKLLRFTNYCLHELPFPIKKNSKFDSKHMSVTECDLHSILCEYIPASDIVNNVLCPYIGYKKPLHIKTIIRNVKIDKDLLEAQSNHKSYDITHHYPSRIGKIKKLCAADRLPQRRSTDKNDLSESVSDSSDVPPRLFGNTDSDESYEMESTVSEVGAISDVVAIEHVSFKVPHRYRMRYDLADDDPERDRKWWEQVKYDRSDHNYYKVGDRVRNQGQMRYHGYLVGTVVAVESKGIKIRYDRENNDRYWYDYTYQHEYGRIKLIKRTTRKKSKIQCSLQRKRNAYSKSNNMCYSKPNFV
eukprot:893776_1